MHLKVNDVAPPKYSFLFCLKMFKFLPIYYVIFLLHVSLISAEISDKRLCANKDCSELISTAKTIMRYGSDDTRILSFPANVEVKIYSKSAGKKPNLWGAEINGKRGYIPKTHILEKRILKSVLEFEVDTEDDTVNNDNVNTEKPSPDPVLNPYDVIEGTTVFYNNINTEIENGLPLSDNSNHKETEPLPEVAHENGHNDLKDNTLETKEVNSEKEEKSVEGDIPSLSTNLVQEGDTVSSSNKEEVVSDDDDEEDIKIEDESDNNSVVDDKEYINEQGESKVSDLKPELSEHLENSESPASSKSPLVAQEKGLGSSHNVMENNEASAANNADIHSENTEPDKQSLSQESNEPKIVISSHDSSNPISDKQETTFDPQTLVSSHEPFSFVSDKQETTLPPSKVSEGDIATNTEPSVITETVSNSIESKLNNEKIDFITETSDNNIEKLQTPGIPELKEMSEQDINDNLKGEPEHDNEKIEKYDLGQEQVSTSEKLLENQYNNNDIIMQDSEQVEGLKNDSNDDTLFNVNHTTLSHGESPQLETKESYDASLIQSPSDTATIGNLDSSNSYIRHIHPPPALYPFPSAAESTNLHGMMKENIASEVITPITDPLQNMPSTNNANLGISNDFVEKHKESEESKSTTENVILDDKSSIMTETEATVTKRNLLQNEDYHDEHVHDFEGLLSKPHVEDQGSCVAGFHEHDCPTHDDVYTSSVQSTDKDIIDLYYFKLPVFAYEVFIVLIISAVAVVVFLWGYVYIDRSRKEVPLVAKINILQKQFLVLKKENEVLTEKMSEAKNENANKAAIISNEIVEDLKYQLSEAADVRISLEQQIQTLEKELENSTEVGLELNRMLSEFLNSDNGSDNLIANIDQLQRQLVEQQATINSYNETLSIKDTENHELRLELEINNSRVNELQSELNKMALNLLKLEEDKEQLQNSYEIDMTSLKKQLEENTTKSNLDITKISEELSLLKQKHEVSQRNLELKTNEYKLLKENISQVNSDNNNKDVLKSMFDTTSIKAELLQLRNENQLINERLQQESNRTSAFEKQAYLAMEDAQQLKIKYDTADQERMEAQTKLEILSNYFKEREAQLQKELSKQESMWTEKQGEATSTIERIKYMQEELQNYKAQYESLKQEIVAQEVDMKSQISVLEKKAHENWVTARQAERKLEDSKQEAAQLRNRLTLRERTLNDDKVQNRLVSPLEQNGDLSLNDTGTTLPLMFGTREHLTTSPPLPGLPHFLPPPPGVPFMPPPLGGVHLPPPGFLPPPPTSMIPGDHRPPPLGRMSSPPLNSRYSPDSMVYSPYDRNSPSPTSDDEYDRPVYRSYSPYNRDDRRDFPRPPPPSANRNSIRNQRGTHSSGSAHSNESLEKINRHNSKV